MSTEPKSDSEEREVPAIVQRLRDQRETHHERSRIVRVAFVVAGFVVLLAGVAMLVLPGPALVVIPIGLAILSLEFAWAANALDNVLDRASAAQEKAAGLSRRQWVLLVVVAALCAAGALVAYLTLF